MVQSQPPFMPTTHPTPAPTTTSASPTPQPTSHPPANATVARPWSAMFSPLCLQDPWRQPRKRSSPDSTAYTQGIVVAVAAVTIVGTCIFNCLTTNLGRVGCSGGWYCTSAVLATAAAVEDGRELGRGGPIGSGQHHSIYGACENCTLRGINLM